MGSLEKDNSIVYKMPLFYMFYHLQEKWGSIQSETPEITECAVGEKDGPVDVCLVIFTVILKTLTLTVLVMVIVVLMPLFSNLHSNPNM